MDGSEPAIPRALGAGLGMMMETLCPKWVTAEEDRSLVSSEHCLPHFHPAWLVSQKLGNTGSRARMSPAPVLTFFPMQCPQPHLLSRHLEPHVQGKWPVLTEKCSMSLLPSGISLMSCSAFKIVGGKERKKCITAYF